MPEDMNLADFLEALERLKDTLPKPPYEIRLHPDDYEYLKHLVMGYSLASVFGGPNTLTIIQIVVDAQAERLLPRRIEQCSTVVED